MTACQRAYFRALDELRRAQRDRRSEEQASGAEAAALGAAALLDAQFGPVLLPAPRQIGFVPPNPAAPVNPRGSAVARPLS